MQCADVTSDGEGNGVTSDAASKDKSRRGRRGTRGPRKQYKEESDWNPQWGDDGNLVPADGYGLFE